MNSLDADVLVVGLGKGSKIAAAKQDPSGELRPFSLRLMTAIGIRSRRTGSIPGKNTLTP
ncbi:hypothetical protein ABIA39_004652 [Nocardia sp. GAS34]|jgi:hypothetical protein